MKNPENGDSKKSGSKSGNFIQIEETDTMNIEIEGGRDVRVPNPRLPEDSEIDQEQESSTQVVSKTWEGDKKVIYPY